MFREPLAGYIKGRPVIYGSANERQSKRNINRLTKRKAFHRNHRLIVITRDYGVEFPARRAQKHRIR